MLVKMPSDTLLLQPPSSTRGMTNLDRNAFNKVVSVPFITIRSDFNKILTHLKPYFLKLDCFKPVRESGEGSGSKDVILNPVTIKSFQDFKDTDKAKLKELGLEESDLQFMDVQLRYENWKADEIIKSVLPEGVSSVTGFSIVGHVIHLNLKEEHLLYKKLIGEVLLDKSKNIRTVVNKLNTIDNTYRNFSMEVLSGDNDTHVVLKENGCQFEFDFAVVYWNSRLATEHERIVSKLKKGDILFDVFAGVGPFAIPAGKKRCTVYANDLNPESSRWLAHNAIKNNVSNVVHVSTLDGREFIKTIVRSKLLQFWKEQDNGCTIHIVMNLPAIAVEFLNAFSQLFHHEEVNFNEPAFSLPTVHCYCFVKDSDNNKLAAVVMMEKHLGASLNPDTTEVAFVRNVAPNKEMFRVSFQLTRDALFDLRKENEPKVKKIKLSE